MIARLRLVHGGTLYLTLRGEGVPPIEFARHDGNACGSVDDGWLCTRRKHHDGDHLAHCDADDLDGYTLEHEWRAS